MIPSFPFVPAKERQMRGSPPGPAWHPAAWLGTAVLLAWVSLWGRGGHRGGGGGGASRPAQCPSARLGTDTDQLRVLGVLPGGQISAFTCDSFLIFRPALSPPMVWDLGSRQQRQLPHRRLTAGHCQHEVWAGFLPGRRSALAWPVQFCGFRRQAEVHVAKLASLSWPQALSESPAPVLLPIQLFICSRPAFISVKSSGAC